MAEWRATGLDSSREWRTILPIAIVLIVFRSAVFIFWPHSYFDSDQAVFGLMAKHIAEGRAFPLFMYGQSYMLAVEAWLAAPLFLIVGPSVAALKFPLLIINIAIGLLLARIFCREVGLRPWLALVATVFFLLPAPATSATFVEAGGGNIETPLYVVLIWLTRNRPNWCGLVLGIGFVNREFTLYGLAALLTLEAAQRVLFTREGLVRRLRMFRTAAEVWLVVTWLKQYSPARGPGTSFRDLLDASSDNVGQVWNRICIDPTKWIAGLWAGLTTHLPRLFGMAVQPLLDYGIDSRTRQGLPWGGLLLIGLFGIAVVRITTIVRRWRPEYDACAYLVLSGTFSFGAYTLLRCGVLGVMRYELLSVLGATGLAAWYLRVERSRTIASIWLLLMLGWVTGTGAAHGRLWAEYLTHPPISVKGTVISELKSAGVRYAYADYWLAYYITFLTNERIIVYATHSSRIAEYQRIVEAHHDEAIRVSRTPCPAGREVIRGVYFCSP